MAHVHSGADPVCIGLSMSNKNHKSLTFKFLPRKVPLTIETDRHTHAEKERARILYAMSKFEKLLKCFFWYVFSEKEMIEE